MTSTRLAIAAAVAVSTAAFAQARFDESTGTCRDASGRAAWNPGLKAPCGDFRGQDLSGGDFQGLDLRGARFDGAKLDGASFFRADLRGATLDGASLRRAVLSGANLSGASLNAAQLAGALLTKASFAHASLHGADLRGADLHGASFAEADLRGATFSATRSLLEGARWNFARVDAHTRLPFQGDELARRQLVLAGPAAVVATEP
ncbi:MAG: pentapeptide repeat-containing protein [Myxococcota bacterium]